MSTVILSARHGLRQRQGELVLTALDMITVEIDNGLPDEDAAPGDPTVAVCANEL